MFPVTGITNAGVISRNDLVGQVLDNGRNSLMNRLYNLFAYYNNFPEFGNEAWMRHDNAQNADSIESIHDVIHNSVGGQGHMTYPDYSAFDPLFWCHHAMMDRLFALWQAINPNGSYVEPMAAVAQTYTIKVGDIEGMDSPLTPFHLDSNGTPHTSRTTVSTESFGYTYPEIANGSDASAVRTAINTLYGGEHKEPYLQYTANIVSPKIAANGSYAIDFFLGDVPTDTSQLPLSTDLIGTHAVFARLSRLASQERLHAGAHNVSGAASMGSIKTTGTVPLTDGLLSRANGQGLANMSDGTVRSYLRDNLHWRVAMMDGTPLDPGSIQDLTISVISAEVQPATAEDEFPRRSNVQQLTEITQGKPGGC